MFLWDDGNVEHIARHGVRPEEAEEALGNDPLDIEEQIVDGEQRWVHLGETVEHRLLPLVVTLKADDVRVVTAYEPGSRWRRLYHQLRGMQHG